jgi:hypothetical protein
MTRAACCLICGQALQQPPTGRRRRYCGPPCRKSAELELRRLQTRLQHLEDWRSNLFMWGGEMKRKQLPQTEAEIERLRKRQLTLLGRPSDDASPRVGSGSR